MKISNVYKNMMLTNNMRTYGAALTKNDERLSTGKRLIQDNPSDILRASRFKALSTSNRIAQRNIEEGLSATQMMDSALENVQNIGHKLRELSIQYKSNTINSDDKKIIEEEGRLLMKEINNIMKDSEFNGIKLFNNQLINIQTGDKSHDNFNIGIDSYDKNIRIEEVEIKEVKSRTYDIKASMLFNCPLTGSITIDANKNEHEFSLKNRNHSYSGLLKFSDSKNATYEIINNKNEKEKEKVTGRLILNDKSNSKEITGNNYFDISSYGIYVPSTVEFNLRSEQIETVKTEKVAIVGGETFSMDEVFTPEFIDRNILNPIAERRARVGINQNILEQRSEFLLSQEPILNDTLSKIENIDMAKEMMNKIKNQSLLQVNLELFSNELDNHRNNIIQLLR